MEYPVHTDTEKGKTEIISLTMLNKNIHYLKLMVLQTLAVFLIGVASLLSTATVGGTPRLNSSLHSSKISSDTNSLSLMLNNPIGTKNKTEIHLISFGNDCLKVNISYTV